MAPRSGGSRQPPPTPPELDPARALALVRRQHDRGVELLGNRPIGAGAVTGWESTTSDVVRRAFGSASPNVGDFEGVGVWVIAPDYDNEAQGEAERAEHLQEKLNLLTSFAEQLADRLDVDPTPEPAARGQRPVGREVFVVHGHDHGWRETVARFLGKLDLNPVILDEQPGKGRTIIEKIEDHADVDFAIVLLTADDRGGPKAVAYEEQSLRARQNVILELGYFMGKLGRQHVCALYEEGVEMPSDYRGVQFVPLDSRGAWRLLLAHELAAAGLRFDLNKALAPS